MINAHTLNAMSTAALTLNVNDAAPRPWKATRVTRGNVTRHVIVDRDGNSVCEVYGESHDEAQHIATFIVRLVGHPAGDGAY